MAAHKAQSPLTYYEILEDWMIRIAEEDATDPCFSAEQLAESAFIEFGDLHTRMSDAKVLRLAQRALRIAENNLGLS